MKANATTLLLCATRLWALPFAPTTMTLRKSVRRVVLKQGVHPRAIDAAEKSLARRGLVEIGKNRDGIALTNKGLKLTNRACPRVELPPWDNPKVYRR